MRSLLSIGDFSRITQLSIKTLRRYHDAGLLAPDQVDPRSGYRYYSVEQIPTAQVIRRFRDLDMPVREIAQVLASTDPDRRSALIAEHLRRLEDQLSATQDAVSSLHKLLEPAPPELDVVYRRERSRVVAAVEEDIDQTQIADWYSGAMTELQLALSAARARPSGAPGGLYDNTLFTHGHGHAVLYIPSDAPPVDGRVRPRTLPERELALTVHRGPHHDADLTYARLGAYLADRAVTVDGPVHETYLVGPRDDDNPANWRTEIGWPVFRTAPESARPRKLE